MAINRDLDPFKDRLITTGEAIDDNNPLLKYFTIFNPDNVVFSDPMQNKEFAEALDVEVSEVVFYKPERLAYHWAIAYINVFARIKNAKHFKNLASKVFEEYVNPEIKEMLPIYQEKHDRIARSVKTTILRTGMNDMSEEHKSIAAKANKNIEIVKRRVDSGEYVPGSSFPGETLESLVMKYTTEDIFQNYIYWDIREIVGNAVGKAAEKNIFTPLSIFKNHERSVEVVYGGPGSGKSVVIAKIEGEMKRKGREKYDVAIMATDRIPDLLTDPSNLPNKHVAETITYSDDESANVMEKASILLKELIEEREEAPYLMFERSFLGFSELKEITSNFKAQLRLHVIHLSAEESLTRITRRASGDFVEDITFPNASHFIDSENALALHKQVSTDIIYLFQRMFGKNTVFEILDNNVPRECLPNITAFGSFKDATLNIIDIKGMIEFARKANVKEEAQSKRDLYKEDKDGIGNGLMYMQELAKYFTLNFVDKETNRIYAISTLRGGLNVTNQELFDDKIKNAAEKSVFEVIGPVEKRGFFAKRVSEVSKKPDFSLGI